MSFYGDYLQEKTNDEIIETEHGFVTYRWLPETNAVYIIDLYTVPEKRASGHGRVITDMVLQRAKERGCTELIGTVVASNKNSRDSLATLLHYGMQLKDATNGIIVLRKDI